MHIFGMILTIAVTLMHIYVFWRAGSVPLIKRNISSKTLIATAVVLWSMFFIGRVYGHGGTGIAAASLELIGMNWMASLFLLFICVLAADIVTCFGLILPRLSPSLRGVAIGVGSAWTVPAAGESHAGPFPIPTRGPRERVG